MALQVLRTLAEARAWAEAARRQGKLALVPTMGFLHQGHLSLMEEAKRRCGQVAVSIFVNPSQFGPQEDLARYPRDWEGDLAKCEGAGVGAVFHPEPQEIYPANYQTWVEVTEVSQGLCGARRPGHFRGVATVVAKLFGIFRPDAAFFGEKDYQQLQVISALNRDLHLGVEVVGMPTVREADGLAKSSRNAYLSPEERQRALSLSQGLFAAQARLAQGTREASLLLAPVREALASAGVKEDYAEVVDAQSLRPLTQVGPGVSARLLVAGFLGKTRLIDNVPLQG